MQDKCPKCGETLITRTIKKELGYGSIDYPIAQECPKCRWSKDLTGAGDIVSKPLAPQIKKEEVKIPPAPLKAKPPKAPSKPAPSADLNKIITIALAILVLGGIVWAFFPSSAPKQVESPKTTAVPTVTVTQVQTATSTPVAEVTPTGNKTRVKLDSRRGFLPNTKTIKLGDEIIWENSEAETVTLVSNNELFTEQILAYGKRANHTFKETGTYSFNLKGKEMKGTITVEP